MLVEDFMSTVISRIAKWDSLRKGFDSSRAEDILLN